MKLKDRTGWTTRALGFAGLMLIALFAAVTRERPAKPVTEAEAGAPSAPSGVGKAGAQAGVPEFPTVPNTVAQVVPRFAGVEMTPMGLLEANGTPMELATFQTEAPAESVLNYYAVAFRREGHRVQVSPDEAGGGSVSYYDAKLGRMVMVTAIAVGTEKHPRTLVFPSVVAAPRGVHLKAQPPGVLPSPEGVVTVMRVDDRNPGPSGGSTTVTQVARGTPAMLAAYYREEMDRRGYALTENRTVSGVEMLEFQKPGERISFSISAMKREGTPESVVAVVLEMPRPEVYP